MSCVHPEMIREWSEYLGNPRILTQRGEVSYVHPRMILGWLEYPDTHTEGEGGR